MLSLYTARITVLQIELRQTGNLQIFVAAVSHNQIILFNYFVVTGFGQAEYFYGLVISEDNNSSQEQDRLSHITVPRNSFKTRFIYNYICLVTEMLAILLQSAMFCLVSFFNTGYGSKQLILLTFPSVRHFVPFIGA